MSEEKAKKTPGKPKDAKKPADAPAAVGQSVNPEGQEGAEKAKKKRGKKKTVVSGNVNITVSYNNTIVTVTEDNGNTICWASCGGCGFKGTRKSTPYASQVTAENALEKAKSFGLMRAHVFIKGAGNGRDQALRAVAQSGIEILSITETTAVAHNGCRSRKRRRI